MWFRSAGGMTLLTVYYLLFEFVAFCQWFFFTFKNKFILKYIKIQFYAINCLNIKVATSVQSAWRILTFDANWLYSIRSIYTRAWSVCADIRQADPLSLTVISNKASTEAEQPTVQKSTLHAFAREFLREKTKFPAKKKKKKKPKKCWSVSAADQGRARAQLSDRQKQSPRSEGKRERDQCGAGWTQSIYSWNDAAQERERKREVSRRTGLHILLVINETVAGQEEFLSVPSITPVFDE